MPHESRVGAMPSLERMSAKGYVARLQRRGYETIGYGGSVEPVGAMTVVLAKPGSPQVIKVGIDPYGDPWPHYAAWCLNYPGPLGPHVGTLRWRGSGIDRFYVATMGRLRAVDWQDYQPLLRALHDWYELLISRGIDWRTWYAEAMDARLVEALADRIEMGGQFEVASFVRAASEAFPSFRWDPQPNNLMVDQDGHLVMIDPFLRTPYELPEAASLPIKRAA